MRIREQAGFTIVEVMVATAILLTGVLGTLAMMDTANKRTRTADDRQQATALARDLLEAVRGLPYRQLRDGSTIAAELQDEASLTGNASTSDWKIERGGTSYAVEVEVCSLDDPGDGTGSHAAGGFCADTAAAGSADGSPADYKRVTVAAAWSGGSGAGRVEQSSLIASRGGGDAPAVASIVMTSPTATPITSTATTSASFDVKTSVEPESVVWLVDGVQKGVASGYGTAFKFNWTLPALDGTYKVEARAFDTSALSGESKSLDIVLNRYTPSAPTGFNAGRNGSVVEAEWAANAERDIVGYRVYRREGSTGSATLACSTETETSCIDPAPPARSTTALRYWVVALDRSPTGADREGAASGTVDVNLPNNPPNAPLGLTLELGLDGRLALSWTLPVPGDPDKGDAIAFFRIYRGGTTVGDRYDRTGSGTSVSWADDEPGAGTDAYWITAVDTHLQESALVGPVQLQLEEDSEALEGESG